MSDNDQFDKSLFVFLTGLLSFVLGMSWIVTLPFILIAILIGYLRK